MKLKAKVLTVFHVDYGDLEAFTEHHYGGSCEIAAIEEANNDTSLEATVTGEIQEYDKADSFKIRVGQYPLYSMSTILDCLCQDGHIERGDYIIRISW